MDSPPKYQLIYQFSCISEDINFPPLFGHSLTLSVLEQEKTILERVIQMNIGDKKLLFDSPIYAPFSVYVQSFICCEPICFMNIQKGHVTFYVVVFLRKNDIILRIKRKIKSVPAIFQLIVRIPRSLWHIQHTLSIQMSPDYSKPRSTHFLSSLLKSLFKSSDQGLSDSQMPTRNLNSVQRSLWLNTPDLILKF